MGEKSIGDNVEARRNELDRNDVLQSDLITDLQTDKEIISKDKESESFEEFLRELSRGNFTHVNSSSSDELYLWTNEVINKYISHQQKKLDAANERILELEYVLSECVKHLEYGTRQWADAFNEGKETMGLKAINKAKELLKQHTGGE